jgi:hypothetical protein
MLALLGIGSCSKNPINPEITPAIVRIDINPNNIFYQQLNTVGGWVYVKNGDNGVYLSSESRGVIIYRSGIDTFKAYDRIPPNNPNQCGSSTVLVVSSVPFVKDPCTGNLYSLTDGTLVKGTGKYPMVQYRAEYDGTLLHIYN